MGLLTQDQQIYYDGNDNRKLYSHGNYQFATLNEIVANFMVAYVGEDKMISKINQIDVSFHAQRAIQELSFDTFKSCKAQEFIAPATLKMPLPIDYVNYTKVSWVDSAGIKHLMYPTSKTSNPSSNSLISGQHKLVSGVAYQNADGEFKLEAVGTFTNGSVEVVLDGDYDNIITGMNATVRAPGASGAVNFTNYHVKNVNTSGGITTVEMFDSWSHADANRTIQFSLRNFNSLLLKTKKTVRLDNATWSHASRTITAPNAAEAAKVEVGMYIIHDDFNDVDGTNAPIVVDVQGVNIFLSSPTLFASGPNNDGSSDQVSFISYDNDSEGWGNYKSATPSENQDDYQDDTYWPMDGNRYGLDPQHAQANGSFYIDCKTGKIHFSSNVSGKIIVLDYISDSLGTDDEMQVHKFAEEAMYKWIMHAVLSTRANVPEYQVARLKKEKRAAIRQAKLRLSNIKLEEITQVLRGKSKQIKH